MLDIARDDRDSNRIFLIEYDRTTRVDKNYEKFRRYDAFLTWWWRHTALVDRAEPPWVLFICQNEPHRQKFLAAADRDLTGHLWHPSTNTSENHYPARRRMLFAREADAHDGILEARRVPGYPPGHPNRRGLLGQTRGVRLPGPKRQENTRRETLPIRGREDAANPGGAGDAQGSARPRRLA
jgi:hypothetical protein